MGIRLFKTTKPHPNPRTQLTRHSKTNYHPQLHTTITTTFRYLDIIPPKNDTTTVLNTYHRYFLPTLAECGLENMAGSLSSVSAQLQDDKLARLNLWTAPMLSRINAMDGGRGWPFLTGFITTW